MDDALKKAFVLVGALMLWGFFSFLSKGPIDIYSLPSPNTSGLNLSEISKISFHDFGYEDSRIQDVDHRKGLVLVTTMDSKMSIIFKPAPENFEKFRIGSIAPVTFECTKEKKGKCDFNSPYKLFISNGLVELKDLILSKK